MFTTKKPFHIIYAGVFVLLLILIVLLSLIDTHVRVPLIREGGAVETLSAIGYFVCLLFFMVFCRDVKGYWSVACLLLCLGLRELDIHHSFSKDSITSIKFWLNMETSIYLKLICAGLLSCVLISAVDVLKKYYRDFFRGLKLNKPVSMGICCGLIAGILSKIADDFFKQIEELKLGPNFSDTVWVLEECMELGIPIFFFIAILAYRLHFEDSD